MKRILFITRSLQSEPGGMQTQAKTFIASMQRRSDISFTVLGYTGGKAGLPFFLLTATFRLLVASADVVHLGDALLSPLLPVAAIFRPRIRRTITVHGLDVLWKFSGYRTVVRCCLRFAHRIAAVSQATKNACATIAPIDRIIVIPCGIDMPDFVERTVPSTPTLLFLGRLVKRKGIVWFTEKVFPILESRIPGIKLQIAGDGYESKHVSSMGSVSEEKKEELYRGASLLIMPNIPVPGDMEGFGITAIEAASRGVPVVAAKLEGIQDAVLEHITGEFFTPLDPVSAVNAIERALGRSWDQKGMHTVVAERFESSVIGSRYVHELF